MLRAVAIRNYMHLLVGFCLLAVVSCRAVYSRTRMLSVKLDHADNEMTVREQFTNGRIKRGIFGIIGKLLQSAKHVDSHTNYRLYIKTGGYKKALSDFEKLNPTALRIYPLYEDDERVIMKGCVQRNPVCAKEMSAIRTCVKNESVDYEQKRRIKNLGSKVGNCWWKHCKGSKGTSKHGRNEYIEARYRFY